MREGLKLLLIPIIGTIGIGIIFMLVVWSGGFQPKLENEEGKFAGMATRDIAGYDEIRPSANCDNSYFPVCGADGKSYDNACKAFTAGTRVEHRGVCET